MLSIQASLSEELHNANAQLEKLHLQISKSVRNFESQDEQIEQLQCQNTSYFNALEVTIGETCILTNTNFLTNVSQLNAVQVSTYH